MVCECGSIGSRSIAVEYSTIMNTIRQGESLKNGQNKNSQKTPYTSPLRSTYGAFCVRFFLEKKYSEMSKMHFVQWPDKLTYVLYHIYA